MKRSQDPDMEPDMITSPQSYMNMTMLNQFEFTIHLGVDDVSWANTHRFPHRPHPDTMTQLIAEEKALFESLFGKECERVFVALDYLQASDRRAEMVDAKRSTD
jgi:hypothetical protein